MNMGDSFQGLLGTMDIGNKVCFSSVILFPVNCTVLKGRSLSVSGQLV